MMTRIVSNVQINQPMETVFEFVTTPGNWPQWHPSSLGVEGATDHSLAVGEACVEAFSVAGRHGRARWTVIERAAPGRWVIEGQIEGRQNGGVISYSLKSANGGTHFEREFIYPTPNLFFRLMNALVIRRRVTHESNEALRRLKLVLEQRSRGAEE
jgi:uncharacterized protein YndB with AHSA1/START domain